MWDAALSMIGGGGGGGGVMMAMIIVMINTGEQSSDCSRQVRRELRGGAASQLADSPPSRRPMDLAKLIM